MEWLVFLTVVALVLAGWTLRQRYVRTIESLSGQQTELESRVDELTVQLEQAKSAARADASAHERTQRLLRDSEERFRLMVEGLSDYALFMLDEHGRIASWNSGATRIYGYLADQIRGQPIRCFYPDADDAQPLQDLRTAADTGRAESEGWRVRKDGTRFWANVTLFAVRDGAGKLMGHTCVTRDLSERRRAEIELIGAKAAAERASNAKSEFLATMSHELRTPLNSLLILSGLLADNVGDNLSARQVEYARTIHSSGMDLLALLNDILDLARIESGARTRLNFREERFDDLARYLERSFRQVAENKNLVFDIALDTSPLDSMLTDPQRLQQILKNLLSNALKFTRAGSVKLHIGLCASGWNAGHEQLDGARHVVAFAVADTGIGIPQDKHGLIFEPFQQADNAVSREFGGTGLGLSISRALARLLGGELKVCSTPGEGSTFTLYLPVLSEVPDESERTTAAIAGS